VLMRKGEAGGEVEILGEKKWPGNSEGEASETKVLGI